MNTANTATNLNTALTLLPACPAAAIRHGETIPGQFMLQHINSVRKQISHITDKKIALYFDDAYLFSLAFIALLCEQKTVIILPSNHPDFIQEIAPHLDCIITDNRIEHINIVQHTIQPSSSADNTICQITNDPFIELFTSGSTGQPKNIKKRLSQLEHETSTLESLWGERCGDTTFLATVSHQHIYGLLFRMLWPFMTGRCFSAQTFLYPEALCAQAITSGSNTLISSPAHLKRFPNIVNLKNVSKHFRAIFSSGGELEKQDALRLAENFEFPVTEIFGSTETGGVAYRTNADHTINQYWSIFPKIQIQQDPNDKTLKILSPYEGSGSWYNMNDRVDINTDHRSFSLQGRTDRIVKIEEKRISLVELENQLKKSGMVSACASAVFGEQRKIIVMAVVLNDTGEEYLATHTKHELNNNLRLHLARFFDAVVIPKKWRYIETLPTNTQGKVTQQAIVGLFATQNTFDNHLPDILSIQIIDDNQATIKLHIPRNLPFFNGHFPGNPILPGVTQIDWAIKIGKAHFHFDGCFSGMEAIKFHEFIRPNTEIELTLEFSPVKSKLHFCYRSGNITYSSGRVNLK